MLVVLVDARLPLHVVDQQVVGVDQDGGVVVLEGLVGPDRRLRRGVVAVAGLLLLVPLVVERLNLVEERLGAEVADVRLLELETLVVQ